MWFLFRVYQLLGEPGTYYGVRFGKKIPWVTEFPFGYIKDPQYVGSTLSLVALLCWVPFQYVLLWCLGYVFMMWVESKEDPATRAKLLSWSLSCCWICSRLSLSCSSWMPLWQWVKVWTWSVGSIKSVCHIFAAKWLQPFWRIIFQS